MAARQTTTTGTASHARMIRGRDFGRCGPPGGGVEEGAQGPRPSGAAQRLSPTSIRILPYTPCAHASCTHSIMDPSQSAECVHIDILKYCLFVEVASGGRVYELVHVRTSI